MLRPSSRISFRPRQRFFHRARSTAASSSSPGFLDAGIHGARHSQDNVEYPVRRRCNSSAAAQECLHEAGDRVDGHRHAELVPERSRLRSLPRGPGHPFLSMRRNFISANRCRRSRYGNEDPGNGWFTDLSDRASASCGLTCPRTCAKPVMERSGIKFSADRGRFRRIGFGELCNSSSRGYVPGFLHQLFIVNLRRYVPFYSTTMRSARRTVESRCAITNTVRPLRQFCSAACTGDFGFAVQRRSRLVENQNRRIFGCARAMAMRCRSPPESRTPRSPIIVHSPRKAR